ncbi:hypothetical protein JZ751_002148 [Albula glossodonta]|uniref:Uncharacterized protein n=1 Tax=Albula glossodonta TaxID=121402 RepID=A0A8T2P4K7_9TELE|nr:hypothetical protein JZ751_002148 [Albula glossodonta]
MDNADVLVQPHYGSWIGADFQSTDVMPQAAHFWEACVRVFQAQHCYDQLQEEVCNGCQVQQPCDDNIINDQGRRSLKIYEQRIKQLLTRRGVGWFAVDPEPTWPELLYPHAYTCMDAEWKVRTGRDGPGKIAYLSVCGTSNGVMRTTGHLSHLFVQQVGGDLGRSQAVIGGVHFSIYKGDITGRWC